jgi:hypothetical protein
MPLTPAFTTSQSALTPASVTATDTATGSDAAVTKRRIYFQTQAGTYLVVSGTTTSYEAWALADTSKAWVILDTDQALSITVQWLSAADAILYTLTQVFCFSQYNKNKFYELVQLQSITPGVLQDSNYFSNMAEYWMNITGAIQAIEIGADVAASQNCLDRATNMLDNSNYYF